MSKLNKRDEMEMDFQEENVKEHETMEKKFYLLSLPPLIIDKILDNLNLPALKRMRLVSKTTKFLVEHPRLLRKFKIDIGQDNIINNLFESTVPWNNFTNFEFGEQDFTPMVSEKDFDTFMSNYGRNMKHVSIFCSSSSKDLVDFLSCLTGNLETLGSTYAGIGGSSTKFMWNTEEISKKLGKILVGLKGLHIEKYHEEWGQPLTFDFFLRHCNCLESMYIPYIHCPHPIPPAGYAQWNPYGDNESIMFLYAPLIEYLTRQLLRKTNSGLSKEIKIRFLTEYGHKYNIDHIKDSPAFFKILKLCSQVGGWLYKLPSSLLPNYNSHYLTDELKEILNHSVATISVFNETGLNNIYFPPLSLVKVFIRAKSTDQNFNDFILNGLVKKIHANITSTEIPGIYNLTNQLFQIFRPTLKKLQITCTVSCQERIYTTPLDISTNFPNLRKLNLYNFNYFGETLTNVETFNNILIGLPYLEHLTFTKCSSLTDDGLLGMNLEKPLIVQLEHLLHLVIHDCSITDKSFKHGFKYLKLQSFYFHEERRAHTNISNMAVTFLEGFSSLVSISNRLCESLEIFNFSLPSDCSIQQFQEYLKKFKYLQKFLELKPPFY